MKLFHKAKDGGVESVVIGFWLCEFKNLFSVVLLKFEDGSRDAYHTHAFDSLNWILKGSVTEWLFNGGRLEHFPSLKPVVTLRETFHKVVSRGTTWVVSLRGPWSKTWFEYDEKTDEFYQLTHGRKRVDTSAVNG